MGYHAFIEGDPKRSPPFHRKVYWSKRKNGGWTGIREDAKVFDFRELAEAVLVQLPRAEKAAVRIESAYASVDLGSRPLFPTLTPATVPEKLRKP